MLCFLHVIERRLTKPFTGGSLTYSLTVNHVCLLRATFGGGVGAPWVPAVNNAGTWGRWAFIEITDPWDAKNTIRTLLATAPDTAKGDPHANAT